MKIKSALLNKLILVIGGLLVLCVFVLLTDPRTVALPLLIVPFILIGIILYQAIALLFVYKFTRRNRMLAKLIPISVALIGVSLLLLQSLHQLTWRDTILVITFTLLLWLYVGRADFLKK
ncbi:MAG: hypothetical protein V4702_06185 [Patescibacteria group bacterium]